MRRIRLGIAAGACLLCLVGGSGTGTSQAATGEARLMVFPGREGTGPVRVFSRAYDRSQATPVADELRALIGSGDGTVSVYIADPEEIAGICGPGTMSCYDSYTDRITISGSEDPVAGESREFALAHEYGHHLANESRGSLWPALASGMMRWATHEHVCELSRSHQVFPGNEASRYWENPGEAFAQSYAQLNFPDEVPAWSYSPLLAPDAGALAAVRRDVEDPWQGPRKSIWRIGYGARAVGVSTTERVLPTPLDGRLTVSVKGPDSRAISIQILDGAGDTVLASAHQRPSARVTRLNYPNCGLRSVRIRVSNPRQGPLRIQVKRP